MVNGRVILLVVIVLGIWGAIGYQLYSGFVHSPAQGNSTKLNVNVPAIQDREYDLTFSYADPFLKKEMSTIMAPRVSEKRKTENLENEKKHLGIFVDWSKIEYLGVIYNASQGIPVAAVRIAGNEYFVRENQKIDIFTIVKIHDDSIQLSVQNQLNCVKRISKNDE